MQGYDGSKYIITFIDGFSGYIFAEGIKRKNETTLQFAKLNKFLGNCFPQDPIAILKPDNAPEYVKGDTEDYCETAGIRIVAGELYNPELHGLAVENKTEFY